MFKAANNLMDTIRLSIAWVNIAAIIAVIAGTGGAAWTLHSAAQVQWLPDLLGYGACVIATLKGSEFLAQKR